MHDTSARLVERVLPAASYRQRVLTVPFPLRLRIARDPGEPRKSATKKRFEQTPLRFAQVAATQSCLPPRGILESKPESRGNPLCKQRLMSNFLRHCPRKRAMT
jgi:hypothetical protein